MLRTVRFRSRLPVKYVPYHFPSYPLFLVQAGKLANSYYNPLPGSSDHADRLHQPPVTSNRSSLRQPSYCGDANT